MPARSRIRETALVTGATGFVGANLVRGLVAAGYRVAIIVRPTSNPWRLRGILGRLQHLVADLADPVATAHAVRRAKPTIIFHTATASTYGGMSADDRDMVRANLITTINLIEACAPLPYRCLVNTGSSSEYGPATKPMRETDLTEPRDGYAITKCAATHYASAAGRREKRPIVTLRLFTPFGPWDDPKRLMPTVICSALANRPLKLARPEIGRDFVYIDDVVTAYLAAIPRAKMLTGEIFNIGSGRQHTLADVARAVIAETKSKSKPIWGVTPASPQDNRFWQADIRKAKRFLKWQPKTSFQEGVRLTTAWLGEHRQYYERAYASMQTT